MKLIWMALTAINYLDLSNEMSLKSTEPGHNHLNHVLRLYHNHLFLCKLSDMNSKTNKQTNMNWWHNVILPKWDKKQKQKQNSETCTFSSLLWVNCSAHVGQFIILDGKSITGDLWRSCRRTQIQRKWRQQNKTKPLQHLREQREQLSVLRQLQVFGEESVQAGDVRLIHLPPLVVHVLHVCGRETRRTRWLQLILNSEAKGFEFVIVHKNDRYSLKNWKK